MKIRTLLLPFFVFVALLWAMFEFYFISPMHGYSRAVWTRLYHKPDLIRAGEYVDLNETIFPNHEKFQFYEAYRAKKGFYGLKSKLPTGTKTFVYVYLFTKDGQLTQVVDKTYDFNTNRAYVVSYPDGIEIGYADTSLTYVLGMYPEHIPFDIISESPKDLIFRPYFHSCLGENETGSDASSGRQRE